MLIFIIYFEVLFILSTRRWWHVHWVSVILNICTGQNTHTHTPFEHTTWKPRTQLSLHTCIRDVALTHTHGFDTHTKRLQHTTPQVCLAVFLCLAFPCFVWSLSLLVWVFSCLVWDRSLFVLTPVHCCNLRGNAIAPCQLHFNLSWRASRSKSIIHQVANSYSNDRLA